jgi:hypothetical protein
LRALRGKVVEQNRTFRVLIGFIKPGLWMGLVQYSSHAHQMRLEPLLLRMLLMPYIHGYAFSILPFSKVVMALFKPNQLTSLQTQPFID